MQGSRIESLQQLGGQNGQHGGQYQHPWSPPQSQKAGKDESGIDRLVNTMQGGKLGGDYGQQRSQYQTPAFHSPPQVQLASSHPLGIDRLVDTMQRDMFEGK